jgi:Ring hydroxylating beta subunit
VELVAELPPPDEHSGLRGNLMTDRSTAAVDKSAIMRGLVAKTRVPLGSEIYNRLLETLYDEAAALDEQRFDDWVAMLAEDLLYTAPIRLTRTGANKDRDVMRTMGHFDDDYNSILMRTGRLTNVRVGEADAADEYEVVSYLNVERSRFDSPHNERTTCERRDVWRLVDGRYKLSRREIIVDQSTLSMSNFAIFL